MMDKFGEACLQSLEIGKRHHRQGRRSVASDKHWELVNEVAHGGLGSFLPVVNLRGKQVNRDLQLVTEIAHLFRFSFKVFPLRMGEDKIEDSNAPLDVFEFVFPAVAKVLPTDLAVQPAREHVIDVAALWEVFCACVFLGMKFAPEGGRALAPMATGEGEELTCRKVAGMRGHKVEKASFDFCVTESLQGFEARRFDVHKSRI